MNVTSHLLRLDVETVRDGLDRVLHNYPLPDSESARALARLLPEVLDALDALAQQIEEEER